MSRAPMSLGRNAGPNPHDTDEGDPMTALTRQTGIAHIDELQRQAASHRRAARANRRRMRGVLLSPLRKA